MVSVLKNRLIKRTALFIIASLVFLNLTACKKGSDMNEELSDSAEGFDGLCLNLRYSEMYYRCSISPEGTFYRSSEQLLHFISEETGEDVIFCYVPVCKHEPASDMNPDPTCRAALFPDVRTNVWYYEGILYYLVNKDMRSHDFYRMKADGAGREFVATIPYKDGSVYAQCFCGDKMYYVADKRVMIEGTEPGQVSVRMGSETYIIELDLKTGAYREVTSKIEGYIIGFQVADGYIWVKLTGEEGYVYYARYDMATLEKEVIVDIEQYKYFIPQEAYEGGYYIWWNTLDKMFVRNMKTGEDTLVFDTDGLYAVPSGKGGGFIFKVYDKKYETDKKLEKICFFDLFTGKTVDITEKAEEYDIMSYDGYNKVFICVGNKRVIGREKILGTE